MESRNILLIVICICAFLVIIFGIGFVWSMPDRISTERGGSTDDGRESGMDIFEHVRDENDPPGLEPTDVPGEYRELVYGEQKDETDTNDLTGDDQETNDLTDQGTKDDTATIQVPKDKEEQQEEYATTWIAKPEPTPRPVQATAAPKKKQQVIEYWIQAAAFESRTRADDLKEKLADHGFQALIKTTEQDSMTLYRVRIGPYTNKKEAEKFLTWLKVLNGMKDSYISQVKTNKYVN